MFAYTSTYHTASLRCGTQATDQFAMVKDPFAEGDDEALIWAKRAGLNSSMYALADK